MLNFALRHRWRAVDFLKEGISGPLPVWQSEAQNHICVWMGRGASHARNEGLHLALWQTHLSPGVGATLEKLTGRILVVSGRSRMAAHLECAR